MNHQTKTYYPILSILIAITVSILVTIILLLILAFLIYKTNISGTLTGIFLTAIYAAAPFIGALLLGKKMKEKRALWGALLSVIYFLLLVIISFATGASGSVKDYFSVLAAVIPGGILGGMFS